jgi:hypothetical protein
MTRTKHLVPKTPSPFSARPARLITGAALLVLLPVLPATAADIRARLTPELVAQHCIANGVGSDVDAVFMLGSGERLSGSVLCTAEDMVVPPKPKGGNDDEDEDAYEQGDDD